MSNEVLEDRLLSLPKKVICIYKITNPKGRVYIGQARCLKSRWTAYSRLYQSVVSQYRLSNSLLKYGVDAHVFEVVEECSFEELDERERHWQEFYEVIGKNGMNCSYVGTFTKNPEFCEDSKIRRRFSHLGKKMKQESIEKRSAKIRGQKRSEETRLKMRNAQLGKKNSEAHRKATSEGLKKFYESNVPKHKGVKRSPETIEKSRQFMLSDRNPHRGKPRSEETKSKIRLANIGGANNPKSVCVLHLLTGIFYDSIVEAARAYGIPKSTLQHTLLGRGINKTNIIRL